MTADARWERYFIIFDGSEGGYDSQPYHDGFPPRLPIIEEGVTRDSQDVGTIPITADSSGYHQVLQAKSDRDAAIMRNYQEVKSELKRERQRALERSRREFEQASQRLTLMASPEHRPEPPTPSLLDRHVTSGFETYLGVGGWVAQVDSDGLID
jgi:hypothetical protein